MPSGAKKRKAAKKKKKGEQEPGGIQHPPSPHSPTSTPQGSSGLESESSDRGEEADMESSGSGGRGEEEAVMTGERGEDYEVREVGIEYVVNKKDTNGTSTHLEQVEPPAAAAGGGGDDEVPISEVVVLEQQETSTDIPPVSTVPDVVERSETAATTEVAPAPLLGHRATLWNCCGLLDAFKGNQR